MGPNSASDVGCGHGRDGRPSQPAIGSRDSELSAACTGRQPRGVPAGVFHALGGFDETC
jgi:hypothetical protein